MNKKVKLAWVDIGMGIGNAYGYSTHARNMKKHVAEIVDLTPDADAAVQIQTPDKFQAIAGKKNFLFIMYEAETIPHIFIKGINHPECHHIIVPCNHNKRVEIRKRQFLDGARPQRLVVRRAPKVSVE